MKTYWFALHPHCFLWVKETEGLIYNTENHSQIKFANQGEVGEIAVQLTLPENLYCVKLTQEQIEREEVDRWLREVEIKDCGVLVEDNETNRRPLSLPPVLKVQDEVDYYRWEHKQGIDGNVLDNLHRLVFCFNGSRGGNDSFGRQFLYPMASCGVSLPHEDILRFARNARLSPFLSEIVLVGDPFGDEAFPGLCERLQEICPVQVSCTQADAAASPQQAEELAEKVELNIAVTDFDRVDTLPHKASLTLVITSEADYEKAVACEEKGFFGKVTFAPAYTGTNLPFFEKFLYVNEEDIREFALSKRNVFVRQKVNVHDFGKLTVMPDGQVYANLHVPAIGHVTEPPHAIVYRELTEGHSWLRVRDMEPCCRCVYQWLCPSPSNYEKVLDKTDLCTVRTSNVKGFV